MHRPVYSKRAASPFCHQADVSVHPFCVRSEQPQLIHSVDEATTRGAHREQFSYQIAQLARVWLDMYACRRWPVARGHQTVRWTDTIS